MLPQAHLRQRFSGCCPDLPGTPRTPPGYRFPNSDRHGPGDTLKITGNLANNGVFQLNGTGDMATLAGNVTNGGSFVLFGNGSMATMTGLTNAGSGFLDVEVGSTLQVNGDVSNSGRLFTSFYSFGGGNTLSINGNLTNNGIFDLLGSGDMATIGGNVTNDQTLEIGGAGDRATIGGNLTNGGAFEVLGKGSMATIAGLANSLLVDVENGSKLQINGDGLNSGNIYTGLFSGGNTLNITGTLTNQGSGQFILYGPGDMATLGSLTNSASGTVDVENGSTLTVNGGATNSAYLYLSNSGTGHNTLKITGTLTNESGAYFYLYGPGDMAIIGNGLSNFGSIDLNNGSKLQVIGDVDNFTSLATSGFGSGGGDTLTITGMLTNSGTFQLRGPGDMAIIGTGLSNAGFVYVNSGSTLQISGDATNSGSLYTAGFGTGGNTLKIAGNLSNSGTFEMLGPGDKATLGGLANSGFLDVENASALQINGDVSNPGFLATGYHGGSGNTLNITGSVTNNGIVFELDGSGDRATIGGNLNNGGNFDLLGNGSMANMAGLANSGSVNVENGSRLQINGDASNLGVLVTGYYYRGGNTVTVNGVLTNEATGQINLNGPGDVLQALAGLINNGVINVNNGSSIDPPFVNNGVTINIDSLSKLIVGTGSPMRLGYIQLANGTLGEIINPTGYGVINVNGSALLDGTLDILLKPGFNPAVGSTYKFLFADPGQISGAFSSILNDFFNGGTEQWLVNYDSADGYVELIAEKASPVPEPGTLLVLIPGLLGVGYGLRRKPLG